MMMNPRRGKYEAFACHTCKPAPKPHMSRVPMNPKLRIVEDRMKGTAVVLGSDFELVKDSACHLVLRGYVPVEDEYFLMEHKRTRRRGHFRKMTFIQKNFYHE